MSISQPQHELTLLQILKTRPEAGQRDMAQAIGLSLGMTNLLMKEVVAKGWVLVKRLNSRSFHYLLTPAGVQELSRRSLRFMKRTIRQVADCRVQLETWILSLKQQGVAGVCLLGSSELDFVVEYLCLKNGLLFAQNTPANSPKDWVTVYSESQPEQSPNIMEYIQLEEKPEWPKSH